MVRNKKKKKLFLILKTVAIAFGMLFSVSGCYPIHLSENLQADIQSEYKTKYFVFKPPQGRWQAVIDTPKFIVPHEGNLLARSMPEIIKFYKIPYVWGHELSPIVKTKMKHF